MSSRIIQQAHIRDRKANVLTNRPTESKDILNYATLVAEYYIFCTIQDSDDVPFDGFPSLLKNKLDILQQIAFKNKTIDNFNRKWKDFI